MNIFENFRIALKAISINKLRSGLTMLGIIIGVAAVVALMAVGQGANSGITERVKGMGTNLITVSEARSFQRPGSTAQSQSLYYHDFDSVLAALRTLASVAPYYRGSAQINTADRSANTSVTGVTPSYFSVSVYTLDKGRLINDQDNLGQSAVAVLGASTATDLFAGLNPIGRYIQINGKNFLIIGVLASKGSTSLGSADDVVLVPIETAYARIFGTQAVSSSKKLLSGMSISVNDANQIDQVMNIVDFTLRREHGLTLTDTQSFSISSQSQMLQSLSSISSTMTSLLGAIAAISLLVGGIGIMNITLVSVRERTREIGLRKAVGATMGVILFQFISETLTISIIGGGIGVGVGWLISWIVSTSGTMTTQVTPSIVILAFIMALVVGLVFGIYPAYQAAGLKPIEALKYE
jgi:putative ABC transport system permease protein